MYRHSSQFAVRKSLLGDPDEYGSRLDTNIDDENRSAPWTSVLSNTGQWQFISGSMQFPPIFSTTEFHNPLNHPERTTTATAASSPLRVPPGTPHRNVASNARPLPCGHSCCVPGNRPPRASVLSEYTECANCGTKKTSAWRRDTEGRDECNACNSYFRRHGVKRPAWMWRDTIGPQYRPSRCNQCEVDARSKSTDFGKSQKVVTSRCQDGTSSSKAAITQNNIVEPFINDEPQLAAAQNVFVPSNTTYTHSLSIFTSSDIHCSTENPMIMRYTAERIVFSAINLERQPSPSEVNYLFSFTRQSQNIFLRPNVVDRQVLVTPLNANSNIVRHDEVKEPLSLSDQYTEDLQKEQYQSSVENSRQQKSAETDVFNDNQFEDQYSETKEENSKGSLLDCLSSTREFSSEVVSEKVTASQSDLTETCDLLQD